MISIGEVALNFSVIQKALYVFISNHRDGFTYDELSDITSNKKNKLYTEFQKLYLNIKYASYKTLKNIILTDKKSKWETEFSAGFFSLNNETLGFHICKINKEIKNKINPIYCNNYFIINNRVNNMSYHFINNKNITIKNGLTDLSIV